MGQNSANACWPLPWHEPHPHPPTPTTPTTTFNPASASVHAVVQECQSSPWLCCSCKQTSGCPGRSTHRPQQEATSSAQTLHPLHHSPPPLLHHSPHPPRLGLGLGLGLEERLRGVRRT